MKCFNCKKEIDECACCGGVEGDIVRGHEDFVICEECDELIDQ